MESRDWIDISRGLSEETAVWPGDKPFSKTWVMSLKEGDACNTSTISLSAHTGTHVDSPAHFMEDGPGVNELPLEAFIGRCRVVRVKDARCVGLADIGGMNMEKEERILFKTPRPIADNEWRDDFTYISVDVARACEGLRLVGIDTPSVDPKNSKSLETHKALLERRVVILENLNLESVEEGPYDLVALPLRIIGGDASPVRAVIRPRLEKE
jgi:arylformamidase